MLCQRLGVFRKLLHGGPVQPASKQPIDALWSRLEPSLPLVYVKANQLILLYNLVILRCLVEDGTAEALVYLSNESISFLLKLSNDELSKLKSYALSLGELVYQRHSYGRDILNKV